MIDSNRAQKSGHALNKRKPKYNARHLSNLSHSRTVQSTTNFFYRPCVFCLEIVYKVGFAVTESSYAHDAMLMIERNIMRLC